MNNEIVQLPLAAAAGLLLGALFFGGLWFTIQKALRAKTPGLWFLGSWFLRVGVVLTGIYYTTAGDWKKFLVCMLGFVAARYGVARFTKSGKTVKTEVSHEA
jgi:F1F0 ATPase subunit 2